MRYQGTCFNRQQVGHKAAECTNARVAQVSEVGTEVQVGSVEVDGPSYGKVWWMCCVEKEEVTNKPQPQQVRFATKVQNKYDCLTDDDDDEEDEASKCNDCISWPVVGKGGKVNTGFLVKREFGKKGATSKVQEV